jgi:hypothetical protein
MRDPDVEVGAGFSVKVTAFESPLASAPESHSAVFVAVTVCGMSPTLIKVALAPALTRVRAGQYTYSTLISRQILIVFTPSATLRLVRRPLRVAVAATADPIGPSGRRPGRRRRRHFLELNRAR